MLMLDLCSGLGGASAAFRDRGWDVVTVDYDRFFRPDVVADIRVWEWVGLRPDFVWASPPCLEFSRWGQPWTRRKLGPGWAPDMSIVKACWWVIARSGARSYLLENVKGAQYWWGPAARIVGPFYLWGSFPYFAQPVLDGRPKESYSSMAKAERAKVPYALSLALCLSLERQTSFVDCLDWGSK